MAILPTKFTDFLHDIRPTKNQRDEMKSGHTLLRDRLNDYSPLSNILVADFLQGSYRRSTAIRPANGSRSDVDIVVVTNLHEDDYSPQTALELFEPFFEKHYDGKYRLQGRSYGVELSHVSLDIVFTSAPSEATRSVVKSESVRVIDQLEDLLDWRLVESWRPDYLRSTGTERLMLKAAQQAEWMTDALRIPDREAGAWEDTHPLEQIRWTHAQNAACNRHYVNVVKALKWWRRVQQPDPKHPKGYPLEHLVGAGCPTGVSSVAEGVVKSLEFVRDEFATDALLGRTPSLALHPCLANRGLPHSNVLARISGEDFKAFHGHVSGAASLARKAYDEEDPAKSTNVWKELFGNKFPDWNGATTHSESSRIALKTAAGFTPRTEPSTISRNGRFA